MMILFSPIIWLTRWMSYINGNSHILTRLLTFAGTQTPGQLNFAILLSTMAPPAVTAWVVLAMFDYDVSRQLSTIQVPALIIAANKDRLTKPVASEFMHAHMPHTQLVMVQPGNHLGLIERHIEVNEAAAGFIKGLL